MMNPTVKGQMARTDVSQKIHKNEPKEGEKMFKIIHNQQSANGNYTETAFRS